MNYLVMNLNDMAKLDQLKIDQTFVFATPIGKNGNPFSVGDVVGVKEPYKKLLDDENNLVGVRYRSDNSFVRFFEYHDKDAVEVGQWSAARTMPECAIRYRLKVKAVKETSLQSFSDEEYATMGLDYASQGNPQLILNEYIPYKNFELLKAWWKAHYKSTLKKADDPKVVLLTLTLYEDPY